MKKIKTIIFSDGFFYGAVVLLLLVLTQIPIIARVVHTPKGYGYLLLDKVSYSDYYYLGITRFGTGPDWLLKVPYWAAEHSPSIIQIFYVILGKIIHVTRLDIYIGYALSRLLGGVLLGISIAVLIKSILSKTYARVAFIIAVLSQPMVWPPFHFPFLQSFGIWIWHFGEATRRIGAMPPHYSVGKALMLLAIACLITALKRKNIRWFLMAMFCAIMGGIIYPPPVFLILFAGCVGGLAYLFPLSSKKHITKEAILFLCFFTLACLAPLLLLKLELAKGLPWTMWTKVELGWNDPSMRFEQGYLQQLGLISAIIPFAFIWVLFKKIKPLHVFILLWAASGFIFFPFATSLSLGKFRFTEGMQVVPLSILWVWFLIEINKFIHPSFWKKIFRWSLRIGAGLFLGYFFILAISSTYYSTVSLWDLWTSVYIRPGEMAALTYVNSFIPRNSLIAAEVYPSNYLPAFANVRTILGFPDFYPSNANFEKDRQAIDRILSGTLDDAVLSTFLKTYPVTYVYRDKAEFGARVLYPDRLNRVFDNDVIDIYQVVQHPYGKSISQ